MKKLLSVVLVALVLLAGCGTKKTSDDTSLSDLKSRGTFILGYTDYPPFAIIDGNNVTGFDIDFAKAVTEKLGVDLELKYIEWDAKIMELESGSIDAIWNGFTITPEREEQVAFSDPYLDNAVAIMTLASGKIDTIAGLAGKRIGVESESSGQSALEASDVYGEIASMTPYTSISEALLALDAGDIDAIVADENYMLYVTAQNTGKYVIGAETFDTESYGIGFRKTDLALRDEVNKIIAELVADNTATKISETWFGTDLIKKMMAYLLNVAPYILSGLGMTLKVFFITLAGSLPLGIILALAQRQGGFVVRRLIGAFTWILRGTPLMLQLYFAVFGMKIMFPGVFRYEAQQAVLIMFILNYAAYFTEIFRSGLQAIDPGQWDAARTLHLSRLQSLWYVILPQMFRNVLRPIANEAITLIKDTSLVAVVGIGEILRNAKTVMSRDARVDALVVVAVLYLALTWVVIRLFDFIGRKIEPEGSR